MKTFTETFAIDTLINDQLRQLEAKGYSPLEAAAIFLQAQEMCVEACQRLLDEIRDRVTTDGKHSGGILKTERLSQRLSLGQLARLVGYRNVTKGVRRISCLEQTGLAKSDLLIRSPRR